MSAIGGQRIMTLRIKRSYETEVYATEREGYVAIKQRGDNGDEDLILLTADQLPSVIKELQALCSRRAEWEHDMADRD
jgi:hypothetical protein